MFEYKVLEFKRLHEVEKTINEFASQGWKVISVITYPYMTNRFAVTLEKAL